MPNVKRFRRQGGPGKKPIKKQLKSGKRNWDQMYSWKSSEAQKRK